MRQTPPIQPHWPTPAAAGRSSPGSAAACTAGRPPWPAAAPAAASLHRPLRGSRQWPATAGRTPEPPATARARTRWTRRGSLPACPVPPAAVARNRRPGPSPAPTTAGSAPPRCRPPRAPVAGGPRPRPGRSAPSRPWPGPSPGPAAGKRPGRTPRPQPPPVCQAGGRDRCCPACLRPAATHWSAASAAAASGRCATAGVLPEVSDVQGGSWDSLGKAPPCPAFPPAKQAQGKRAAARDQMTPSLSNGAMAQPSASSNARRRAWSRTSLGQECSAASRPARSCANSTRMASSKPGRSPAMACRK